MPCWCSYCRPGLWILVNPCRVYNCANDHHSLLFPSIRAIVNSLNSLPLLPLIAELDCFSRYMNMRPNRMTLWLTCVVHNTVTTQFWKSNVGMTPGASVCTGSWLFSIAFNLAVVSNQKRQFIYYSDPVSLHPNTDSSELVLPEPQTSPNCLCCYLWTKEPADTTGLRCS